MSFFGPDTINTTHKPHFRKTAIAAARARWEDYGAPLEVDTERDGTSVDEVEPDIDAVHAHANYVHEHSLPVEPATRAFFNIFKAAYRALLLNCDIPD
jgi:hypothetical protein